MNVKTTLVYSFIHLIQVVIHHHTQCLRTSKVSLSNMCTAQTVRVPIDIVR